jgi:hypothetical protein
MNEINFNEKVVIGINGIELLRNGGHSLYTVEAKQLRKALQEILDTLPPDGMLQNINTSMPTENFFYSLMAEGENV